ncbi:MAG: endonuclease/exonuclease/phosphatase family protein [Rhodothermales bacterium]
MIPLFLDILAGFVILGSVLPLVRTGAWWVRIFDFPRGQLAVLGLAVALGYYLLIDPLETGDQIVLAALGVSVAFLIYRILPYTRIAPYQTLTCTNPDPGTRIRLLCSNVLQSNREAEKLLALIHAKQPDLVLVVETDTWWREALGELDATYPHRILHPLDNTYGMLCFSRLPIEDEEVRFLVEDDVPSIFATVVLPAGARIRLVGMHPRPPRPDILQDSTYRDAELLIVARYAEHQELPVIVLGDFNDVAWSHTTRLFQRIGGLLDPRRGRGLFSTFHADYPFFRYPLDHVFHSPHFQLEHLERLGHVGSDHFPIFTVLNLTHDPAGDAPDASEEDVVEAKRLIREAFI